MYLSGRQGCGTQLVQGAAVTAQVPFHRQFAPGHHDGGTMTAHAAADQHRVPGAQGIPAKTRGAQHADARRVDVQPVGAAPLHHLGVAGYDLYPGLPGGAGDGLYHRAQILGGEPLLQNQGEAQVKRFTPCHADVVDGTADGQLSDVPARELPGGHHKTVGGKHRPAAQIWQHGAVPQVIEGGVAEGRQQDFINKLGSAQTAAAVIHGND